MIDIEFDGRDLERFLGQFSKQMPFAISTAINETLKDGQRAQRAHQRSTFTVRRPQFVDKAVKIKPFANKRTLEGSMLIDPPGGQARADILAKFESGGRKQPKRKHIAIPVGARKSRAGIVTRANRPKALNLTRKGKAVRGDKRTYVVPNVGIFQRKGKGKRSKSKMLYAFKGSVPIPRNLRFIRNFERIVERRFDGHMIAALNKAIATAK